MTVAYNRDADPVVRGMGVFQDLAALGKFVVTGLAICLTLSGSTPAISGDLGAVSLSSLVQCLPFVTNVTVLGIPEKIPSSSVTSTCNPVIDATVIFYTFLSSLIFFVTVFVGTVCLNRKVSLPDHSKKIAVCIAAFTLIQACVMFGGIFALRLLTITYSCTSTTVVGGIAQAYDGYCSSSNFTFYAQTGSNLPSVPVVVPCLCEVAVPQELWILSATLLLSYLYLILMLSDYVKKSAKKLQDHSD